MNILTKAVVVAINTTTARLCHLLMLALAISSLNTAQAATTIGTAPHYAAVPPLIDLSGSGDKPNVLIILDNSNSMDEAPNGSAVGSDNAGSKSEIARNAVKTVINSFGDVSRLGLMSYQQSSVNANHIHNSPYDVSFDPANYDPNYNGSRDSLTKKYRTPNSSNPGAYLYYNIALPFYSSSNQGSAFCRSATADFDNGAEVYPAGPWDTHECFSDKTDASDTFNSGFSSSIGNYSFVPSDSDLAQGILDFGRFFTWNYVGKTWFSNVSPGKGMLHVGINDVDAAHKTKLLNKLATSQFTTATDTPLRNAGLTPIQGTLQSAASYFNSSLTPAETAAGASTALPTANVCSANSNFVVLVTDGLPSVDASGTEVTNTATAVAAAATEAANLLSAEGVKTYVVAFALPNGVDPLLFDQIASAGGTTNAYIAGDSAALNTALGSIFLNISNRLSSATGAAVLANSSQGGGAIFQANYTPKVIDAGNREVNWVGGLSGLFIDEKGYLREDSNGNKTLDGYDTDAVVVYFYDTSVAPNRTRIRSYLSGAADTVPNFATVTPSIKEIEDLDVLWQARDKLAALTNVTAQRAYDDSAAGGRHILTSVDGANLTDFITLSPTDLAALAAAESSALSVLNAAQADVIAAVGSTQVIIDAADAALIAAQAAFNQASLAALNSTFLNYLMESSGTNANQLVNYIRGEEQVGSRSRTIDIDGDGTPEVWRLGDIIHSTPALVAAPSENYDALYNDKTYAAFRELYKNRRHMVYVGANDGMLHGFNAGFWDKNQKKYELDDAFVNGTSSLTAHPLGTELWSYIPRSGLPHLRWLKDAGYAHSYYVDGEPKTFDANIFPADAVHPYGWGTVLVVGMRLGGGEIAVDSDGDGTTDTTTYSSYIIMDVTNPEAPPTLIAEVSHSSLGFTTSEVGVVKKRIALSGTDYVSTSTNDWHLVFGSGPDTLSDVTSTATAKVFVYDLITKAFITDFAPKDLGIAASFVGNVEVANWDGNFIDDTAYFGVIGGTPSAPVGKLMRYQLDAPSSSAISTLLDTSRATVGQPLPTIDGNGRKWVYFGTGRLFDEGDNLSVPLQRFYGVMEPVDSAGAETWTEVTLSTVEDVTDIRVFEDGYIDKVGGGAVEIPSGTALTTFDELKYALPKNKGGWFRDLNPSSGASDPSGRNVNYAVKARSIILFVEYTPSGLSCQPEGTSVLYGVDFQTGTATPFTVFGSNSSTQHNTANLSELYTVLGQGLAGHLSPTSGDGDGVRYSDSTGKTGNVGLDLGGSAGGRQSWLEIELK
ncbi:pilus assembly protein [Dasania marina]|uniref:pilus assembly protein n=1 Tax=Dasania marina TaxID=471499 RepID=UPI0003765664|nr:PilC/PilY family type IV pilus protein [Dasania marina]